MIVVRIELHSAIDNSIKEIGTAVIYNDGNGSGARGNYGVCIGNKRDAGDFRAVYSRPQRRGRVTNYPRLSYNVWRLIARAILSAFPEERK